MIVLLCLIDRFAVFRRGGEKKEPIGVIVECETKPIESYRHHILVSLFIYCVPL